MELLTILASAFTEYHQKAVFESLGTLGLGFIIGVATAAGYFIWKNAQE